MNIRGAGVPCVISGLLPGPAGPTGAGGAIGYYGSFYDKTDQPLVSTTASQVVSLGMTSINNGVSIAGGNRVLFDYEGIYSITFSMQWTNPGNSVEQVNVWLKKNGNDIADTNTRFDVPQKKNSTTPGHCVGTVNFVLDLNDADYIQVYWSGTSTNLKIEHFATGSSPAHPETPGIIITAVQTMYSVLGGGSAFDWQGAWDNSTAYVVDDVVEYNGSSYISIQDGTNQQPDTATTYWELMAAKGDTGATGATGAQGPQGDPGPQGPQGDPGPAGATGQGFTWLGAWNSGTAYVSYDTVSYNGSSYVAVAGSTNVTPGTDPTKWELIAQKGDTGATGATGAAGAGVDTGGTAGQYLKKDSSTDYDTSWATFALTNSDIASGAAIAYSKLNLSGSIVNADIASGAAVAYSKLNLSGSVVNADIATGAAIAWSKVSKTGSSLADLETRTTANLTDFPAQTSQNGKYLKTDGTSLSWDTPSGGTGNAFAAALLFGGF